MRLDERAGDRRLTPRSREAWQREVLARLASLDRASKAVAAAVGVSTRRLNAQLVGRTPITLDEALAVLEALDVPTHPISAHAVLPRPKDP